MFTWFNEVKPDHFNITIVENGYILKLYNEDHYMQGDNKKFVFNNVEDLNKFLAEKVNIKKEITSNV